MTPLTVDDVRKLLARQDWGVLRDRFVDDLQTSPGAFRELVRTLTLDERELLCEGLLRLAGNGVVH